MLFLNGKRNVQLLAALAVCGLLAGCAPAGTTSDAPAAEQTKAEPWRSAYKAFLSELCTQEAAVRDTDRPDYDPNAYPGEVGALSSGYALYDIDKDGVPELLVRFGDCEAADHTKIYTFRDGEMALAGDLPSGHTSFYTSPGENAMVWNWGHMGAHYVEELRLADGVLEQETVFEETLTDPDAEYTDMTDIVPGSRYLWEARTTLGLWMQEETGTVPVEPLTLPIDDYGRQRTAETASETPSRRCWRGSGPWWASAPTALAATPGRWPSGTTWPLAAWTPGPRARRRSPGLPGWMWTATAAPTVYWP